MVAIGTEVVDTLIRAVLLQVSLGRYPAGLGHGASQYVRPLFRVLQPTNNSNTKNIGNFRTLMIIIMTKFRAKKFNILLLMR